MPFINFLMTIFFTGIIIQGLLIKLSVPRPEVPIKIKNYLFMIPIHDSRIIKLLALGFQL